MIYGLIRWGSAILYWKLRDKITFYGIFDILITITANTENFLLQCKHYSRMLWDSGVSGSNNHSVPQVVLGHLCLNPTSVMLLVLGHFKTLGKDPNV
jgi:hypothetical protein